MHYSLISPLRFLCTSVCVTHMTSSHSPDYRKCDATELVLVVANKRSKDNRHGHFEDDTILARALSCILRLNCGLHVMHGAATAIGQFIKVSLYVAVSQERTIAWVHATHHMPLAGRMRWDEQTGTCGYMYLELGGRHNHMIAGNYYSAMSL